MSREEFIHIASTGGYASKRTAENYAGDRTDFSDVDLQEVWRIYDRKLDLESCQIEFGKVQNCCKLRTSNHLSLLRERVMQRYD